MNRQNIEQIIRDLFKDKYRAHPALYKSDLGEIMAGDIAEGYWDTRLDDEIERDQQAGVTKGDYINWCVSELKEQEKIIN